jgi:cysteine desulfurase / selenocysteine lyase
MITLEPQSAQVFDPDLISQLANNIYQADLYRKRDLEPSCADPIPALSKADKSPNGETDRSGLKLCPSETGITEEACPPKKLEPILFHETTQDLNDQSSKIATIQSQDPLCLDRPNNLDYYFLSANEPGNVTKPALSSSADEPNRMEATRRDFPILQQSIHGRPLIWFDNAATTQKPKVVLNTLTQYYNEYNSNIHRATHDLARRATTAFEAARDKVQHFIGAANPEEVIFLRGTTEAINLVTQTYGKMNIHAGDEILISQMEHHSNIVPWQMLQQEKGAIIKVIPINDHGEILLTEYQKLFTPRTRMVALTHVSNVLGTINPLRAMIETAHYHKACVLVDGAQSAPHFKVDMRELDADFYAFSGHKVYGPTGIGVLYGKKALLEEMPPWQGGGGMIKQVTFEKTSYQNLPYKFEAGTVNIGDAIGLGAAIDYLQKIGLNNVERHERNLTGYAMNALTAIPGLCLIGTASDKISVITFIVRNFSPEELAHHLDQAGIAVRIGHHCAQPTLERFGVTNTIRVSLGLYNTREEVDTLWQVLNKLAGQTRIF